MGEIVNLRATRKRAARQAAERDAAENRARYGRTKAEKSIIDSERALEARRHDGHRVERDPGDA